MPRPAKHKAVASSMPEPNKMIPNGVPERLPSETLLDPASLVARCMMRRMLASLDGVHPPIGSPGSMVLVRLPSVEWAELARKAWSDFLYNGVEGGEGDLGGAFWRGPWIAFVRSENGGQHRGRREDGDNAVADAMWTGLSVVGFSPDASWLPRDLVDFADHRLDFGPLTAADIAEAAYMLAGHRPASILTDAEAAAATPRILRLCRRPDQMADDYIGRLRSMLAPLLVLPDAAIGTPDSPRSTPTLDRLHGMDELVEWGMGLARDLEAYRKGEIAWAAVDSGCLVSGPPGCGKTLFARALAATCGVPLIIGGYGLWHSTGGTHQGDLFKAMRRSFADAKDQAPAILFIDEIDSFSDRATLRHEWASWEIQIVNQLLSEIDGVSGLEGVVILGCCNHPHKLDAALTRAGRLGRHIRVGLPDTAGLERILREHLGADLGEVSLSGLALMAAGSSGADCEMYVRSARQIARQAGRQLQLEDLEAVLGGAGMTDAETWIAAIHESGHVVATLQLMPGTLDAVSLRSTARGSGGVVLGTPAGPWLSADTLHRRLVCILAGRAAEELSFRAPFSGSGGPAASDLAQATLLAVSGCSAYGFDSEAGLLWIGLADAQTLPDILAADSSLAVRVRRMLDKAYHDALELLAKRMSALQALASALVQRRALDGKEAAAIAEAHPASAAEGGQE